MQIQKPRPKPGIKLPRTYHESHAGSHEVRNNGYWDRDRSLTDEERPHRGDEDQGDGVRGNDQSQQCHPTPANPADHG